MEHQMIKRIGYMTAMRDFFGQHPGQSLAQFTAEVREAGDREFFSKELERVGYELTNPTA
jgi:uncharacterized protein YaiI (UPF0178 family)